MGNLTIVSACFYENAEPAEKLVISCDKLGLNLSLYGIGEEWGNWRNIKVVKLLEYLENITSEYVLYTDASDSWMLSPENVIIEKFLKHDAKILVSGERSMFPFFECDYPKGTSTMRYICAGSFMGRTEDVKKLLSLLLEYGDDGNDQYLWHKLFLDNRFDIHINYSTDVFLTMANVSLDELTNRHLIFKETWHTPCVIHFNGGKGGSDNEKNMEALWAMQKW